MARPDYLVVGAGFAGATVAERLAAAGASVLVIEQRSHVGGSAHDAYNDDGILCGTYGPHIFHTNSQDVFAYLSQFTTWWPYTHRVKASVSGSLLPMPINHTTLTAFGGNLDAATAALITPYTRKQWGCEPDALDPSVLARIPVRDTAEDRYFTDTYQCQPSGGFTRLVSRMLARARIQVLLNASWDAVQSWVPNDVPLIYTGPLDEAFTYQYGRLPWRSATFASETLPRRQVQPVGVVNYPAADVPYTRVTEWKHLTGQLHPLTTLTYETPCADGDPFWPVPTPASLALAKRYKALAALMPRFHLLGRLGSFQYLNIDQVVAQALTLARHLVGKDAHAYAPTS